jgi:hypothetical protein
MANPPGGPLTGGMEAQQDFALRTIKEKQAAQPQQPVQREQPPAQEQKSVSSQADREAAIQKNLEQNERVKEARVRELAEKLAPTPQREQQPQQQQQRQPEHER